MNFSSISRRKFVKGSILAAAPIGLAATGARLLAAAPPGTDGAGRTLNVVCVGGHPDDPESGCSGTLSRYAEAGHRVSVVYLTRGERGVPGKGLEEAARIRTAECEAACQIMGAKAIFAGQIDGATELNHERVEQFKAALTATKPDILFTHWPIDTHLDHQIASMLTIRSYLSLERRPQFYFFEVNTGSQSMGFVPTTYVDVTAVLEKKKSALLAHRSQNGDEIWRVHHEPVTEFRGRESGVKAAEAFFHLERPNAMLKLPGA